MRRIALLAGIGLAAVAAVWLGYGGRRSGPAGNDGDRGPDLRAGPPSELGAPGGLARAPRSKVDPKSAGREDASWSATISVVAGYPWTSKEIIVGADVVLTDAKGVEHRAKTGATGIARFDGLPEGAATVRASAAGYAIAETRTVPPENATAEKPYSVGLDAAESVGGLVVDGETSRPIAGASVTAFLGGAIGMNPAPPQRVRRTLASATTDATGRFHLEGIPQDAGSALRTFRVDAPGFRTVWHVPRGEGGTGSVTIRMVAGGTVEGVVSSPEGAPVAGATVVAVLDEFGRADPIAEESTFDLPYGYMQRLYTGFEGPPGEDASAALTATTGPDGRFTLNGLGFGERYAVAARAPGAGASEIARDVRLPSDGSPSRLDLRLRTACRLVVRCLDATSTPWPRLYTSLSQKDGARGSEIRRVTNAAGEAVFDGLTPGDYYVRVPDDVRGGAAQPLVHATPGDVEFVMHLEGRPSKPKGDPFSAPPAPPSPSKTEAIDALVRPPPKAPPNLTARLAVPGGTPPPSRVDLSADREGGWAGSTMVWTPDVEGHVRVEWTLDWSRYRFTIDAPGFLPIVRDVDARATGRADLGVLTLDPGEALSGVVVGPDGSPLAGVAVEVTAPPREAKRWRFDARPDDAPGGDSEPQVVQKAQTAADGSFRVSGLRKGAVGVAMTDARFLPFETKFDLPRATSPERLVVRLGGFLRVRAVDADGHPAGRRGVSVRAPEAKDDDEEATGITDVTGRVTLRVPPGAHRVEVSAHPGYVDPKPVSAVVPLEDGETRDVRIVVPSR